MGIYGKRFFIIVGFFMISLGVPAFAQSDPDMELSDAALDAELEWIRAEAEAEIVTVATKTKMSVREAPSIVTVITGEEIRNMGARSLADVLRTLPGFDILFQAEYAQPWINIRGMNASEGRGVKIMLDGHTVQVGIMDMHSGTLPMAGIRKIEIIRGPGSAIYGTGAFLGVINIITRKGGESPSRVSLEGGSDGTAKPSAEFSYKKDDFGIHLYADSYRTDGYDAEIESDAAADSPVIPDFGPLYVPSASREMSNDRRHQTLRTHVDYKDFHFSGFLQKSEAKSYAGLFYVLTDEDELEDLYAYGELRYRTRMADRGNLLMKMYYDYMKSDLVYEMLPEETAEKHIGFLQDEGIYLGPSGKTTVLGGEVSGDCEALPGVRLSGGLSYEEIRQYDTKENASCNVSGWPIEVDGVTYPPFPYQRFPVGVADISGNEIGLGEGGSDVFGIYGLGTLDLRKLFSWENVLENLTFTAGLRYDHYRNEDEDGEETSFSSANPRFGLAYAPTERLWFKLLFGEAFRAPSLTEMYLKGNAYITGNRDLKPEKVATSEALAGYRFSENIGATFTCFHVSAEDLIRFHYNPSSGKGHYMNLGKTESAGLEFELKANFGRHRYAWLNLTWQDVRDTTNGEIAGSDLRQADFRPSGVSEFYGNMGVNCDITEKIIANLSVNYRGERERSGEKIWDGEKLVRKDPRPPVDDYWLLNASFTFRDFLAKGLEFQISGFNLLDEDHRSPDLTSEGSIENDIPLPGRSFTGRISYSF